ncbi:MAG: Rrf2 family transcriptional regulator [bacterium]
MKFSSKSQYGLRAMAYLADLYEEGKAYPLKIIAQEEKISFTYLEKIIGELEKEGIVKSKKGMKGGYYLARRPEKITVGEIIRPLEGIMNSVECLNSGRCSRLKTCRTRGAWKKIYDSLNTTLDSITLIDLIKK